MSTDTTFTPKDVLNGDNNYVLQHEDIINLLKYVWTGALIATSPAEYQQRVGVSADGYTQLKDLIDPLLLTYGNVRTHCKVFKDVTYPSIVALSNTIYDYAQNAGGTAEDSYYDNIFANIRLLIAENSKPAAQRNQGLMQSYRDTITALVDVQVDAISGLQQQANGVTANLVSFEEQCKTDQNALTIKQNEVTQKLKAAGTDVDTLIRSIETFKQKIRDLTAEYDQAVIIAATSATYSWVPFVGWIAAATTAGIFGAKAVQLKKTINALNDTMNSTNQTLDSTRKLIGGMNLADKDLVTTLSLIGPAVHTIEAMMGVWFSIAGDLGSAKTAVDNLDQLNVLNNALTDLKRNGIMKKWNDLKDAVDRYRQVAFISTPEIQSLADYSNSLTTAV